MNQLLEKYDELKLARHYLMNNGLKIVQGPSKVTPELIVYLRSVVYARRTARK